MIGVTYKTKKELKAQTGKTLNWIETSMFGREYKSTGTFCVVGPDPYRNRKYFAQVTMQDDIIEKVE